MSLDQIRAEVICDSVSDDGWRITSMIATINRFVLAELNTHRLLSRPEADAPLMLEEFSRNSASSRAIPLHKQIDKVMNNHASPVVFPLEQKGMQGGDEVTDVELAEATWGNAAGNAVGFAERLGELGVHKSVANRLLEPFLMHTVVLTATSWDGFWSQRLDENAQPEIKAAAEAMKAAYDASSPVTIMPGFWHLPLIQPGVDIPAVEEYLDGLGSFGKHDVTQTLVAVSTARCARVSYETHDGRRDIGEDVGLYNKLRAASPVHYSPAEHPCTPEPNNVDRVMIHPAFGGKPYAHVAPRYGNVTGWHQHRFDLMGAA